MESVSYTHLAVLRDKIYDIDRNAFLIVSNAREVYGLGFKSVD